jgi:uncharacterized membrane-anchored protein YitT (DUF2179 family)
MGCMIVSIGIMILKHAQLVTGGTAGIALSLSYLWNTSFSTTFLVVNIPFYLLSILRMGWSFTLSTLFAVVSLSLMTEFTPWVANLAIPVLVGSVLGGLIVGAGLILLFTNGSSLGGANILTLYLQKRFGWDPGKTTFVIDFLVVVSGIYSVGLMKGLYSILSILVLSCVISVYKNKIAA